MSSSHFTSFIYLLTFALLLQTIFGADNLFHLCSSFEKFRTKDPYDSNLQKLLGSLAYKTPPKGFDMSFVDQYQFETYGLTLCRGDVNATECKTCVDEAINEIQKLCPFNKGAIIWYDNCLLKYLNKEFFDQINNQNNFTGWSPQSVIKNTPAVNRIRTELLTQLAKEAIANGNTLYVVGDRGLGEFALGNARRVFGLAQCTVELSNSNCFKCLNSAIGQLPLCCDGKLEGRVVGGSCNIRYEVYPFVNT